MKRLFVLVFSLCVLCSTMFSSDLTLNYLGRYESGMFNTDGGVMEIVAYSPYSQKAYAVNGQSGFLSIIGYDGVGFSGVDVDVKSMIEAYDSTFSYGDMTSVSTSEDGRLLALALQSESYSEDGRIALFNVNEDGSITFDRLFTSGVQPDMVTFSGNMILSTNEGEPRNGYENEDPKGSVSVINLENGDVDTIYFDSFDERRDELTSSGIIIKKGSLPSRDFEPEYLSVSGKNAYVTLQEANAVAVLNLESLTFTSIVTLGFEDYSVTPVDLDKKDEAYAPSLYPGLYGIRMADGIASYTVDGGTYIVTANEGDSREWEDYLNEVEVEFEDGALSPAGRSYDVEGKVVFFDSSDYDGLNDGCDYIFGGRSMTIYSAADGSLVYTSADDAERITASALPLYFNASNDNATIDDRSGKKGPEPESVTVGEIDGRYYAFLALERTGGIMVYDVTDPYSAEFVTYSNTRDFETTLPGSEEYDDGELDKWVTGGDVAPEGLCFIPSDLSPIGQPLLIVAYEVSGTVAVFSIG